MAAYITKMRGDYRCLAKTQSFLRSTFKRERERRRERGGGSAPAGPLTGHRPGVCPPLLRRVPQGLHSRASVSGTAVPLSTRSNALLTGDSTAAKSNALLMSFIYCCNLYPGVINCGPHFPAFSRIFPHFSAFFRIFLHFPQFPHFLHFFPKY